MTEFRATLTATPASVRQARHLVRSLLPPELNSARTFAELLTAELVNNALVHVGTPMTVHGDYDGTRVRVDVEDDSPVTPSRKDPGRGEERGRGIILLEGLATAWGCEPSGGGKVVWFEINLRDDA